MDATTQTTDRAATKAGKATKASQARTAGAAAADADARPVFHISPEKLKLAEQVKNDWVGVVPAGTRAEDLDLKAEPFALIAQLLHKGDDIRLFTADDREVIDLVCVQAAGTQALCRVTQVVKIPLLSEADQDRVPAGFEVVRAKASDEQEGWLVRRLSDGVLLNAGTLYFQKEDAIRYLLDHASVRAPANTAWHLQPRS